MARGRDVIPAHKERLMASPNSQGSCRSLGTREGQALWWGKMRMGMSIRSRTRTWIPSGQRLASPENERNKATCAIPSRILRGSQTMRELGGDDGDDAGCLRDREAWGWDTQASAERLGFTNMTQPLPLRTAGHPATPFTTHSP
jgi:hypothetical protein